MIEKPTEFNGAEIKAITISTGTDASPEYNAFKLVLETNNGTLIFEGCHDAVEDIRIEK